MPGGGGGAAGGGRIRVAEGSGLLPSARRVSASGVWGELSILVAVIAFW